MSSGRHPVDAPASPAVLVALAATCAAVALLEPGWRLACGLGAIAFGAVALVDLRYVVAGRRWLKRLRVARLRGKALPSNCPEPRTSWAGSRLLGQAWS